MSSELKFGVGIARGAIFFLMLLSVGCSQVSKSASHNPPEPTPLSDSRCKNQILDRIYFGTGTPNGKVSNTAWKSFLRDTVTPRFPQGLTVIEGDGQWSGNNGKIVSESSHILELLHEDSPQLKAAVEEIAEIYKKKFNQEAVLLTRVTTVACLM